MAPVLDQTSKGRKDSQSIQTTWPLAVCMELERQARNIRGTVNRARGLLDGKTVLYWPWTNSTRYFQIGFLQFIHLNLVYLTERSFRVEWKWKAVSSNGRNS